MNLETLQADEMRDDELPGCWETYTRHLFQNAVFETCGDDALVILENLKIERE